MNLRKKKDWFNTFGLRKRAVSLFLIFVTYNTSVQALYNLSLFYTASPKLLYCPAYRKAVTAAISCLKL